MKNVTQAMLELNIDQSAASDVGPVPRRTESGGLWMTKGVPPSESHSNLGWKEVKQW
jgi:hypothetical protein